MPTVLIIGAYRFLFYSNEGHEPPHVHVRHENKEAKFWLDPVELARNARFARHELNRIAQLVEANKPDLLKAWHDFFGNDNQHT